MSGGVEFFVNVVMYGLGVLLGVVVAAVFVIIMLGITRSVASKIQSRGVPLTLLRAEARVVARSMYTLDPMCSAEQTEAFLDGVTWTHGAMRRGRLKKRSTANV